MRRPVIVVLVALIAGLPPRCTCCAGLRSAIVRDTIHDSVHAAPAAPPRENRMADTGIVRALYVNRWALQSAKKMRALIAIADKTEINALVIDMKDEFGLNFESRDTIVSRNAGGAPAACKKLVPLLDTLKAHRILAIARVVVFKDSVAARVNPQHVIRKPDGTPWHDKKGLTWVIRTTRRSASTTFAWRRS